MISKRVLIVDNNPSDVMLLEAYLRADATAIRSVTESREVDKVMVEFRPDIVLLDLHMPSPDGFEIMRSIRRAFQEFLPIVVLTADESTVARNRALIGGADDFLTKPLDRHEVVLRIRNLLRTRQLYVELAEANEALKRQLTTGF